MSLFSIHDNQHDYLSSCVIFSPECMVKDLCLNSKLTLMERDITHSLLISDVVNLYKSTDDFNMFKDGGWYVFIVKGYLYTNYIFRVNFLCLLNVPS